MYCTATQTSTAEKNAGEVAFKFMTVFCQKVNMANAFRQLVAKSKFTLIDSSCAVNHI